MTFISYIIVLVGGPIVLTISTLILGFLIALLLAWTSIRFRVAVAGFASGVLGVVCVWLFGNWIFEGFAHEPRASLHPSIAVAIAIAIPFFNDLNHTKKVKEATSMLPAHLDEAHAHAQVTGRYAQLLGYVVGAVITFGWLASRVAA
ncbi:hypothetical protein [Pseudoxanthomonas dokdonensis]|uniref:Uncharacterized protein n=1 Tax=Pseudoxanthomonas dokdonensis TaxID=344882 RepID=A0A0R0CPU8_9GAMM|nr:hypothetical protein [Pseudoxanthomonas dokdonensis]KRG71488.1 hypothetical protein ABB29_01555 [Pseudoxanthomonas dokdonensis]